MKKVFKTTIIGLMIISMLSIGITGCSNKNNSNHQGTTVNNAANPSSSQTAPSNNSADEDGDGIPDAIEKTYGTNPHSADTDGDGINDKDDKQPVFTDNLIKETSTSPLAIKINDARVEDNATADHMEITMVNTGNAVLNNFDIYYTITDKVDKTKKEAYYQVLKGLSLKEGETKTIHFDNSKEAGHYYGNMNGLYGTSKNGLSFDVQLHAKGFAPLKFNIEKAKGTAEVAD